MSDTQDEIIIRRTVDGMPADAGASDTPQRAASTGTRTRPRRPAPSMTPADRAAKAESAVRKRAKHDPYIWGIYIMLLIVSVVELFSASSTEIRGGDIYAPLIHHALYLAFGLLIVLWIQNVHYGYFARFAPFLAAVSLILLLVSSFMGAEINGAQRAISLAGFTIQPAEIVKLTVVVLLATILGRNQQPGGVSTKGVIIVATVVVIFSGILWINGLTNTLLLMGVSISMFLIGGIQWRKLLVVALVYGLGVGVIYMLKYNNDKASEFDRVAAEQTMGATPADDGLGRSATHENRFKSYLRGVKATDTVTDRNRQVFYAKMSQANGGLLGRGPGNSRESARLPLAFSDYIYSIVVEDTGFIGGIALLLLYLFLLARAGRVAYKCSRAFPAFLIMGCAVLIVFQALVHMAIVTGVAPVSGQPLPLISKGGTSILIMSTAIGIMLSVSRFAVTTKDKKAIADEINVLPSDMGAANVSLQEREAK